MQVDASWVAARRMKSSFPADAIHGVWGAEGAGDVRGAQSSYCGSKNRLRVAAQVQGSVPLFLCLSLCLGAFVICCHSMPMDVAPMCGFEADLQQFSL